MPTDTGAPWELPYPQIGDQADVPADMGELANKVAEKLTQLQAAITALPPYRQAAGSANIGAATPAGATTTAAITFPAGRFTVAPIVTASVATANTWYGGQSISHPTTSGFTYRSWNLSGGSAGFSVVNWHAVQMTAGAAAG